MNVSDLMRGLIGNLRATHSHSLQLKVGDVVKGTVVKVLSNDQALVNINGSVINAKLETPLQRGDVTMLQVQPESSQGLIVLKPLGASQVAITNESLASLLKQFGLNNSASERLLLQQMHLAGLPLNKENVARLAPVLTMIDSQANAPQTIQAGIIALQRGLPVTEQTVRALQQVLFGQPLDRVASALLQNIVQLSTSQSASAAQPEQRVQASTQQLLIQLQEQLQHVITTARQGVMQAVSSPGHDGVQPQQSVQSTQVSAQAQQQIGAHASANTSLQAPPSQGQSAQSAVGQVTGQAAQSAVGQAAGQTASVELGQSAGMVNVTAMGASPEMVATASQGGAPGTSWISNVLKLLGINHEQLAASLSSRAASGGVADIQQQLSHSQPQPQINVAAQQAQQGMSPAQQAQTAQTAQTAHTGQAEQAQLAQAQATTQTQAQVQAAQGAQSQGGAMNVEANTANQTIQANQAPTPSAILLDNVKSMLLQLNQMADLPQAVRDSAQQLLQHITGQQLFLASDRASQFAHMTLFIPLYDEHGSQTAAINIQSRKGQHGGLDPKNCRMVFDLNMQHLGETLIDVNVTNKIVSVQMHNDHPIIGQLLEEGRAAIQEALLNIGYQLSSLTHAPFPNEDDPANAEAEPSNIAASLLSRSSIYNVKPYKGLDVRI